MSFAGFTRGGVGNEYERDAVNEGGEEERKERITRIPRETIKLKGEGGGSDSKFGYGRQKRTKTKRN